jgi:hypothetical protein
MLLTSAACSASATPGLGHCAAWVIALKYSNAVYSTALTKLPQMLTKVHSKLATFSSSLKKDLEVANFVNNPTLISSRTKPSENGRLGEAKGIIEGDTLNSITFLHVHTSKSFVPINLLTCTNFYTECV